MVMFKNAMQFNPPKTIFHEEAQRLNKEAESLLKKISDKALITEPEDEGSPEEDISQAQLKKLFNLVIDELKKLDSQAIFYEPVESSVPGYYQLIERPLDFQTLKKKIAGGHIKNWVDFRASLLNIFVNATKYNAASTLFHKQAKAMIKKIDPTVQSIQLHYASSEAASVPKKSAEPQVASSTPAKAKTKKEKAIETPMKQESVPETRSAQKRGHTKAADEDEDDESHDESASSSTTPKRPSSVKRKYGQRPPPANELDLPPMDDDVLKSLQSSFLKKLQEADVYQIFLYPVEGVPGYTDTIEKPMDFSTIEKNISQDLYSNNWRLFEEDIELVFANAKKFNTSSSVYFKEANRLLRVFRRWKKDLYYILVKESPIDSSKVLQHFESVSHYKPQKVEQALIDEVAGQANEATQPEEPDEIKPEVPAKQQEKVPVMTPKTISKNGARPMSETITELIHCLIEEDSNQYLLQVETNEGQADLACLGLAEMSNKKYKKLTLFEEDFKLLCDNVMTINESKSNVVKEVQRLLKFGEKKIEEIRSRLVKKTDKSRPSRAKPRSSTQPQSRVRSMTSSSDLNEKQQIQNYKNLVIAANNINQMQKKPLQSFKSYCPLSEVATVPLEILDPPLCRPGEFPLYEFIPQVLPQPTIPPLSHSPLPFAVPSASTSVPIMSQLFQGANTVVPSSSFTLGQGPVTPLSMSGQMIQKVMTPMTQVQPFSIQQPALSYRPIRVIPKIQMLVKRKTDCIGQMTHGEFEQISNASIEECLRSSDMFQMLSLKRAGESEKDQEKVTLQNILARRSLVQRNNTSLLSLMTDNNGDNGDGSDGSVFELDSENQSPTQLKEGYDELTKMMTDFGIPMVDEDGDVLLAG